MCTASNEIRHPTSFISITSVACRQISRLLAGICAESSPQDARRSVIFNDLIFADGKQLGCARLAQCPSYAMANREHPHRWPPFIDLINDPTDVRLLAVEQVPQDRGPRELQTQRGMPCLRRIPSKTSLAGRVRPWATSSSP